MHQAIGDFLLDIVQNSWEAGASQIEVDLVETASRLDCAIRDNGKGMDAATLSRALDPFWTDGIKHPHRKVGLGLPFLQQTMDDLGSHLDIQSVPGKGTSLRFGFPLEHIDCPPTGDLVGTIAMAMRFEGNYELVVNRQKPGGAYVVSRSELVEALGELDTVGSIELLRTYLESLEEDHGENEP